MVATGVELFFFQVISIVKIWTVRGVTSEGAKGAFASIQFEIFPQGGRVKGERKLKFLQGVQIKLAVTLKQGQKVVHKNVS